MIRETARHANRNPSKPTAQPVASSSCIEPLIDNSNTTSDRTYELLRLVGAPEMSSEDFSRLYKGPLADALLFVAEHLVGRKKTAATRLAIHQMRDNGDLNPRAQDRGSDVGYTSAKRAAARLISARNDLDNAQSSLRGQQQLLRDLQRGADQLQAEYEEKRLTSVLLSVLETKENIRRTKSTEIARLTESLKKECIASSAALHAHHICLSRLATHSRAPDIQSQLTANESRLRTAIARSMGKSNDDQQVVSTYEQCLQSARARATENLRYQSPLTAASIGSLDEQTDLNHMLRQVAEQEIDLQHLSDRTVALGLSCAHSLQAVTTFTQTTATALRHMLQEQAAAAQGHVDVLRLSIIHRVRANSGQMPQGSSESESARYQTLKDVEDAVEHTNKIIRFLQGITLNDPSLPSTSDAAKLADFSEEQAEVGIRLKKLLTRKLEKARAGDVLVADVERLIAEVGTVAGMGA
ncbi:hypothetical protein A0H81_05623 [Grifola frondosa]|uniref:Uncharacterized protein n=1 Tax=Grifola frondosa TaxID=5627 RepID=A0A1C7MD43_GRIFR|nr:hypothetical protein A0H81_05623 [Grifola frondosa]